MTKSNGEEPKMGGRMERFQQGVRKRTLLAKKKVQNITKEDVKSYLFRNAFVLLTVTAVIVGTILGFALRPYKMSYREVKYFSFPGELLMRMLQMLVLPLIISSLVTGMASLDSKASGKMGMRAVVYYMTTTIIAVVIGIIIVIIIHPGKGTKENMHREGKIVQVTAADAFLDLIRYVLSSPFPWVCFNHPIPLILESCFKKYKEGEKNHLLIPVVPFLFKFKTNYEKRSFQVPIQSNETLVGAVINNVSEAMETLSKITEEMVPVPGSVNGINALGLVVFSMCFGFVIGNMKEQGQALREFFDSLNEAIMRLVAVIMWYAPLGILFLIAGKIVEMEDMGVIGGQLAMYTVTVIVGLLIHAVIVLPLLYFLVTRKNPWVFIGGLLQALITALGTSSSSATLPITFKCLEENNGVDKRVTRFVLPVGATINMDGTALYEALAAIFIAQVNNFELNFGQIITISITATAASIGAAGIPQAGLVTMVIVLTSVGLPTDDITLIIAVDWFLDRLRTTTNVLGDSLGAGIIEHLSRHELKNRDVEMGNSVIEENEMKKPYQLIAQESETEKPIDSETKM
ncbi:PREDICTED: excitatory amino acid transporter 1 [Hipposideros armiger]|uniref:Amino acid transporter n=1 Tax=Hipposideros armiger TaxID=186990 RepID=A0A8B7RZ26_HIPAR|nr:PREDICTED: excitatory amino acid transporter 1 [Hipposideros armiger]